MSSVRPKHHQTLLNHMCGINFLLDTKAHRQMVTLVGTIGPSCRNVETICEMMKAGMNIVRINFSHETREDHILSLKIIREAQERISKEQGYYFPLGIVADLKGREVRTGYLYSRRPIEIKSGDTLKLSINEALANRGTKDAIYVDYPSIIKHVDVGQNVFIDDNAISLEILEVGVDCLLCRVLNDAVLRGNMSVVVPGTALGLPVVSEKDVDDIKFSIENKVDFFFLSKLRTAADVQMFRNLLTDRGKHIKIFTKLENIEALENLDEIVAESDGVIFARADLSIELGDIKIFLAQKAITARCNRMGKPVMVATQLLMSMNNSDRPVRNDISDIGNAILDGVDGLLLSSETAIGQYPEEAMKTLAATAVNSEAAVWNQKLFKDLVDQNPAAYDGAHAIAISAVMASLSVLATAILVLTASGKSAQLISMYRPLCPVLAVTRCNRVARQMTANRGVFPLLLTDKDPDKRITEALHIGNQMGIVKSKDAIIVLSPLKDGSGYTNNVSVIYAQFS